MTVKEQESGQLSSFFKPDTFKHPSASGAFVWFICLVVGSMFPDFTSLTFRIIAISISFIIALLILIENRNRAKPKFWLLMLGNTCLIFVNASGINSITQSVAKERIELNHNDSLGIAKNMQKAAIFDLKGQKSWWPDNKLLNQKDSLEIEKQVLIRQNQKLLNQLYWLRDHLNTKLKNYPRLKKELSEVMSKLGEFTPDSSDISLLRISNLEREKSLNKTIDSLQNELMVCDAATNTEIEASFEIWGKTKSASQWVDTLFSEYIDIQRRNRNNKIKLETAIQMLKIGNKGFDTIRLNTLKPE